MPPSTAIIAPVANADSSLARNTMTPGSSRRDVRVLAGSNVGLADPATPVRPSAAEALVAEAMRDDVDTPLYVCAGAGLTWSTPG